MSSVATSNVGGQLSSELDGTLEPLQMQTEVVYLMARRNELSASNDLGASRHWPRYRTLGHFCILEPIGRGGCGTVVKALDTNLDRIVAIKLLSEEMATAAADRQRFAREARFASAVCHENVVCIYEVQEEPIPYLVMEYVSGESLQIRLDRSGPMATREILSVGAQIARGLAAAHATGVVHRDVKPANVLLESGDSGAVKLTDFGIAYSIDDPSLTQTGIVVGTPLYMSPEHARGESVDHRADLFSLGSVLYAMVTGRAPFEAGNSLAVIQRITEGRPDPIREIVPEALPWLCDLIERLHALKPTDRIQTATEVAEQLETCLEAISQGREATPIEPAPTPRRKSRRKVVALAGVFLILAAASAFGFRAAPATMVQAQSAEASTRDRLDILTNDLGMKFVRVPAGASWLGGRDGIVGDEPVTFDHDFFMGSYEVTQADWRKVMGVETVPSRFSRAGDLSHRVVDVPDEILQRYPVEDVSWDQCQKFIRRLNSLTHETGWEYRLPRSSEWEYACRGGPGRGDRNLGHNFYFQESSKELVSDQANFVNSGHDRPRPVGSYAPNPLGIYDMHGNVFEMCDDITKTDANWASIFRGGFWGDQAEDFGAEAKRTGDTGHSYHGAGFRLVRVRRMEFAPVVDPRITPAERTELFRAEMKRLNPDLRCPINVAISEGKVSALSIHEGKPIRDLRPIRLLPHLQTIEILGGSFSDFADLSGLPLKRLTLNNNWVLTDLRPLRGMALEKLEIWGFQGTDLSPLAGMPLSILNCGGGYQKLDLTPLKGMPLKFLCLNCTATEDLSPLRGMPLDKLLFKETLVANLEPLRGMKVREIHMNPPLARASEIIREMTTLTEINEQPAAEFWSELRGK